MVCNFFLFCQDNGLQNKPCSWERRRRGIYLFKMHKKNGRKRVKMLNNEWQCEVGPTLVGVENNIWRCMRDSDNGGHASHWEVSANAEVGAEWLGGTSGQRWGRVESTRHKSEDWRRQQLGHTRALHGWGRERDSDVTSTSVWEVSHVRPMWTTLSEVPFERDN